MLVLAISTVWVGVIGAAVGGFIGLIGTLLAQWLSRAERSRQERKEAYVAFLTSAEDCLHHFERLAEGYGSDEDRTKAHYFYDENVTGRLRVMEIIGRRPVVDAAADLRRVLNRIDELMINPTPQLTEPEFKAFVAENYRPARDKFTDVARADLERRTGQRIRRLTKTHA